MISTVLLVDPHAKVSLWQEKETQETPETIYSKII